MFMMYYIGLPILSCHLKILHPGPAVAAAAVRSDQLQLGHGLRKPPVLRRVARGTWGGTVGLDVENWWEKHGNTWK